MAKENDAQIVVAGEQKGVPAFLGGDSTIEPVFSRPGKVESYNVTFFRGEGVAPVVFNISKQQGDDLISARLSMLTREVIDKETIEAEVFQSMLPTYVVAEYKRKYIELGYPEEELPKTDQDWIILIKENLVAYREGVGREQIASAAQGIADEILDIALEVYRGNKHRYNELPDVFKEQVDFHLPSMGALAAQHSGINEETLEAQRTVLKLNLMAQEETRNTILEHFKATVGAGGEAIGMFFGQMFGGAKGASEVAYKSTKEALGKKK